MTWSLSPIPDIVWNFVHLRLRIVDWAENFALSPGLVGVWCGELRPFGLPYVLSSMQLSVLAILPALLLLVVVPRLLNPIAHHVVALGPRSVDLFLGVDFCQFFGPRIDLLREKHDVVELFRIFDAQKLCFLPIECWDLVRLVIHLDLPKTDIFFASTNILH